MAGRPEKSPSPPRERQRQRAPAGWRALMYRTTAMVSMALRPATSYESPASRAASYSLLSVSRPPAVLRSGARSVRPPREPLPASGFAGAERACSADLIALMASSPRVLFFGEQQEEGGCGVCSSSGGASPARFDLTARYGARSPASSRLCAASAIAPPAPQLPSSLALLEAVLPSHPTGLPCAQPSSSGHLPFQLLPVLDPE